MNPYGINIGEIPNRYIKNVQLKPIADAFENGSMKDCIFYGPSGCGKTVAMTMIRKKLIEKGNWIGIDLNPVGNLLQDLIGKLYDSGEYIREFINTSLNLSKWGIGLNISENPPAASLESALEKIIGVISDKNKKLLVCIDEVTFTDTMKSFLNTYQIIVRQDLPLYMLMAGLYVDIENLSNENNLTFLNRMKKTQINSLALEKMCEDYISSFHIDEDSAYKLAVVTKGFPAAYQLLGEIVWDNKDYYLEDTNTLTQLDSELYKYAYKELFRRLSPMDIDYLIECIENDNFSTVNRRYFPCKRRLTQMGIIEQSGKQYEFRLPRFDCVFTRYVKEQPLL